jgi:hypothetical protein
MLLAAEEGLEGLEVSEQWNLEEEDAKGEGGLMRREGSEQG